jgi:asparagine synthase (glutamine-hydrolysing)
LSGVCGIWTAPADGAGLSCRVQAGLDAIAHRGPDGFSIYPDRNIALGHCLFDTGCNGMHVDEDGYAVSFDGRIDNRDELLSRLQRDGGGSGWERWPDKALLLAAYRHLGEELPLLLRGDFAVAIWDPVRSGLFLCRDHFGVKPLFWREAGDEFYFASEIKALRAMTPGLPLPVEERVIAGFMRGAQDAPPPECTAFEGVYRLLPAHRAWLDRNGMRISPYWSLNPPLPVRRHDAAAEFKTLFKQAIDRRTRTTQSVGALLSGGLDSSSIVSMIGAGHTLRRLGDIAVFSLVFEKGDDESEYIAQVENKFGFTAHRVDGSGIAAFDDCDTITAEQDQPIPGPNIATLRYFIRSIARQDGTRVLLDGNGGDEVVSYGNGIFQELAESGRWLALWRQLGRADDLRAERGKLFRRLVRRWGLRSWRRWAGWLLKGRRRIADPIRYAPDGRPRPTEQAAHLSKLSASLFAQALEVIDHNAAAAGVEMRMPFMDVDLVSFCVTLPANEKWSDGRTRVIVRRALAGILPEAIAGRLDKFDFTDHIRGSMVLKYSELIQNTLQQSARKLADLADPAELFADWEALRDEGTLAGAKFQKLWRAVMLGRWYRQQEALAALPMPFQRIPEAAE